MLFTGFRFDDMPFPMILMLDDKIEEYFETQIEMQRAAIEEALSNFWNSIN